MSPPKYTRLDKDKCAFLFIDHQAGLIQLVHDFSPERFRNNVLAMVDIAKFFDIPCVLTTSFDDGPNGPIVKEIGDALKDSPFIRRPGQINAADNEDFMKAVKKTDRKQVVISGVLTEVCATFPALSLVEQGYEVFVATDASGTFSINTRECAHRRLLQHGVQLLNWAAIASELQRDWRNDVKGFARLWKDYVPGYWCLIQSHENAKEGQGRAEPGAESAESAAAAAAAAAEWKVEAEATKGEDKHRKLGFW